MKMNEVSELLNMRNTDGTTMSVAEKIATLPPEFVARAFETHWRIAEESGQKKTMNEVVCRLLASGMPADEMVMLLCVKAEVVDDAAKYEKEIIAKYSKQLNGRRQRAKKKQNGGERMLEDVNPNLMKS
jgi:hypothetical protein